MHSPMRHIQLTEEIYTEAALIEKHFLLPNGQLVIKPAKEYSNLNPDALRYFCHKNARYCLPTLELIVYLSEIIYGKSAIEICAGHGEIGYVLNIPRTDNKVQLKPDVKKFYEQLGQPTIQYPDAVERLDALDAVKKYQPQIVISAWGNQYISPDKPYTVGGSIYGVKENKIIKLVDKYISIHNLSVCHDKKILKIKHESFKPDWLLSRSKYPEKDVILTWNNNKRK